MGVWGVLKTPYEQPAASDGLLNRKFWTPQVVRLRRMKFFMDGTKDATDISFKRNSDVIIDYG